VSVYACILLCLYILGCMEEGSFCVHSTIAVLLLLCPYLYSSVQEARMYEILLCLPHLYCYIVALHTYLVLLVLVLSHAGLDVDATFFVLPSM